MQRRYEPLPRSVRLQRWLQRVYVKSKFMRKGKSSVTHFLLPEKLAEALKLPDAFVTISVDGELHHSSCSKTLARYIEGS